MTSAAGTLCGMKISLNQNKSQWVGEEYKPRSFGSILLGYLDTANGGPFRTLQIGGKLCSLLSLISSNGNFYKEAGKICTGGWTATIIPRVPGAFVEAKKAIASVFSAPSQLPGSFVRKCVTAVQESATFIAAAGYATAPFLVLSQKTSKLGNSVFKAAETSSFVGDSCEMVKSGGDMMKTRAMLLAAKATDGVSSELTSMLADSEKLYFMKTMKAVCSVASFVLGLAFAATGLGVLPGCAIMAASISLASSLFGAGANLQAEGMKYKSIQFYDDRHVQLVAPKEPALKPEEVVKAPVAQASAPVPKDPYHEEWTIGKGIENATTAVKSGFAAAKSKLEGLGRA